jgi:hypothetical protein
MYCAWIFPEGFGTTERQLYMSLIRYSRLFPLAFVFALGVSTGSAQSLVANDDNSGAVATAVLPTSSVAPVQPTVSLQKSDSLWWVHAGVTAQLAGTFADWATSWKQPEGNSLLAQSGGEYAGRFYRSGTAIKFGIAAGVTAVSYVVACKWPKTRKYVGIFNLAMGAGFSAQAFRNVAENPYYKP